MINQSNGRTRAIGHDAPARRRRAGVILLAIAAAVFLGGGTLVSYYVDALWFDSLGYAAVFWTRINLQVATFASFATLTFVAVYGAFLALKPARFDELIGGRILINQQWVQVPIEPVLKLVALGLALAIAAANGGGMMSSWTTFALFWEAPRGASMLDPIFGRPLGFYLFTLVADDGAVLEVDGKLVVDASHSLLQEKSQTIVLANGLHPIRVRYFNRLLGGSVKLWWTLLGRPRQIVPNEVLSPEMTRQSTGL